MNGHADMWYHYTHTFPPNRVIFRPIEKLGAFEKYELFTTWIVRLKGFSPPILTSWTPKQVMLQNIRTNVFILENNNSNVYELHNLKN